MRTSVLIMGLLGPYILQRDEVKEQINQHIRDN